MPKNWVILIAFAAAWLGYAPQAKASELSDQESKLIKDTFGCVVSGNKCVVDKCLGTRLGVTTTQDFVDAAKALFINKTTVILNGNIGSACIVGVDRLLYAGRLQAEKRQGTVEQVICMTTRANFYFHKAFTVKDKKKPFIDENGELIQGNIESGNEFYLNRDLQSWVDIHSPLPLKRGLDRDLKKAKTMNVSQALAIWPQCRPDQKVTQEASH